MLPDDVANEPLITALLTRQAPPDEITSRLAAGGLTRLDVWSSLATAWMSQVGPQQTGDEWLPAALGHAASAPDPDAAALGLSQLQQVVGVTSLLGRIVNDPRFGHDLLYLLGLGTIPTVTLLHEPGLMDVLDPDLLEHEADAATLASDVLGQVSRLHTATTRRDALRRWKRGQFLRIIARDLLLRQPQQVITREISAVADACLQAALAAAYEAVLGSFPTDGPRGLAVIGMGKWGSRELNYNSDIDLLCVYDPYHGGPSAAEWEQVAARTAQELQTQTAEGRVFRVDFRLRPEGATASLVRSLEGCVAYYESHSAPWEVQALTRARFVGGDAALGRQFEALAERIAFGTRMGPAGIEHIRTNRRRLDERAGRARNVKEGPGGIRDIEFTTQLLQLARGVTDPAVRARNTWHALDALADAGAISDSERRNLGEAYDFLRRVEHLLQLQPTSPTKEIPTEPAALRRLARAMGYRDGRTRSAGERFLEAYDSQAGAARQLCNRLFFNPIPLTSPGAAEDIQELLDPLVDDQTAARHLADLAFDDAPAARRRLLYLAHGQPPMRLPDEVQALFVELLPALLACIQRMPDPDAALLWFERFISCAGGRDLFYKFLGEHPPIIELLCRIAGYSDALSQLIVDYPEYLNCVIHPSFVSQELPPDLLFELLAERLAPLGDRALRLDDIRRFRRREAFRIGVRDILGLTPVERLTADLSDLAQVVLKTLLQEVRAQVKGADQIEFAVLGCGKFGGRELHYSSDLDVLFVFRSELPEGSQIAEKLARQLSREAGERTRAGRLYELDARLRPDGGNGPLARSLGSYQNYYQQRGETWERLALSRARCVAGDAELGAAFEQVAQDFAYGAPPDDATLDELRRIKYRIEHERRDTADRDHLDPKLEPGGIMDVEFLVQILQLLGGPEHPELRQQNTVAGLQALAAAGLLSPRELEVLRRNYLALRRLETRLQLVLERSSGLLPLDGPGLATAAKRLGWTRAEAERRPAQLLADVRGNLVAVREIYEARIGARESSG